MRLSADTGDPIARNQSRPVRAAISTELFDWLTAAPPPHGPKEAKKKSLPSKSIPNLLVSQQLLGNRQRYFLKIYFRLNVILLEAIFSSKLITSLLFLDIENSLEV